VLLALVMAVTGSSAPAAGAVGSYYASAAAWAWNATWLFGGDKLIWAILLALAGGVIGVILPLIGQMWKKAMGRSTRASKYHRENDSRPSQLLQRNPGHS
jgi:H+/Cl- antiporter ClcA